MSTIIPYFDPILGKLRNSDVALISVASLIVPDPLIVNNLIVNSNATINKIYSNEIYASTATIGTAHISNIDWNLTSGATISQEGQMKWDANQQTAVIGMAGGNVDLALGMELLFPRRVRNSTGSTMAKGTVVYINGVSGNTPTVERAIATSDQTSAFTLGMTAESINDGATGWVTTFGELTGIDLSAYTGGDTLYLSGATAGAFTNVPQSAPIHYVRVGTVVKATADGALIVNILNGYELNELHNVVISSLASGQIIQSGASSLWYNRSLASAVADFIVFPTLPSLGSLAVQNNLSYYALDSRLSLGSLAVQDTVNFYNLVSYPSLGSLSVLNSLSYYALDSRLSLGSLAVQNNLSYFSLDSRLSLGSLAVISTVDAPLVNLGTSIGVSLASISHNSLGNLTTGDPHTQYALLEGRSGGQTLEGGTAVNNLLILRGTSANGNTATNNAIRFGVGNGGGTYALDLRHNGTINHTVNTTTNADGYKLNQTITGTTGDSIGAFFDVTDSGGGLKTIYSHRAKLTYSGATIIQGMQSTSNQMVVNGGGTVNAAEILTSNFTVTNNSTVNDVSLIRLFDVTKDVGSNIGTLVGLRLPTLTQGNTNWSIYSDGGAMYHSGNINIGSGYFNGNYNYPYGQPQIANTGDILSGSDVGVFQFDSSNGYQYLQRSSNDVVPPIILFRKSAGTSDSLQGVTPGDVVGRLSFYAYTGAAVFDEVARITAETVGGADTGAFRFWTAATGGNPVERLTILDSGLVGVGVANPAQKLDVNGVAQATDFYATDTDDATTPAFTWKTDTNTGMFNLSADVIGFTTGGTARLYIGNNGLFNVVVGTAAAPSYSFNADNDTGMFRQATNAIGFTTNGTESLRISAVGNVQGMGTVGSFIPHKLTSAQRDALTNIAGMLIYNTTTNKMQVRTNTAWVDLH